MHCMYRPVYRYGYKIWLSWNKIILTAIDSSYFSGLSTSCIIDSSQKNFQFPDPLFASHTFYSLKLKDFLHLAESSSILSSPELLSYLTSQRNHLHIFRIISSIFGMSFICISFRPE